MVPVAVAAVWFTKQRGSGVRRLSLFGCAVRHVVLCTTESARSQMKRCPHPHFRFFVAGRPPPFGACL